jgi:hypothetical protein
MNGPGHPSILISTLIVALILWRLYARFRRSVGRQHLSKVRPWITVSVFPILIALFVLGSFHVPMALLALLGGTAVGIGLGIFGLRLTRFEVTPTGLYYTPSAHLGIALSLLLVARVGWRFIVQGGLLPPPGTPPQPNSPLTLLVFGALAGYYTAYAIGLLRWRQSVVTSPPVAEPAKPQG